MAHCFGGPPVADARFLEIGSPTNRLLDAEEHTGTYVGMPRMGAVAVSVRPG